MIKEKLILPIKVPRWKVEPSGKCEFCQEQLFLSVEDQENETHNMCAPYWHLDVFETRKYICKHCFYRLEVMDYDN